MKNNELIIMECRFNELSMNIDKGMKEYNLNERTTKSIINSLKKGIITSRGEVWISKEKIWHILRKKSEKESNYEIEKIKDIDKININGEKFINSVAVIDFLLRKSVGSPNNDILSSIIDILVRIQKDKVVQGQREKYNRQIKEQLAQLGKIRVKDKGITKDELTGEALKKTYDFHHVRARSISGNARYELDIELGLVINKKTHRIITKERLVDEDELYIFCMDSNWEIDWYNDFKEELKKYK